MDWGEIVKALGTALGIGLLVGAVRERQHGDHPVVAGMRTHALLALLGAVAAGFGTAMFATTLAAVALFAAASYHATRTEDPGLTGEVAMLVSVMLGGLARESTALAAGLGVVVALLLWAKEPLRRFSRELVSERELQDALLLAAAALVVLPLLPTGAIDPWGVVQPAVLWRLVVLVMAVGMLGHIALRAVGARRGLPVAGFFSGFASSTAAVAGYGQLARTQSAPVPAAAAAALLANLASLLLLAAVVGAVSPLLLRASAWSFAAGALGLLAVAATGLHRTRDAPTMPAAPQARAFHLTHALAVAALIAVVMLVSEAMRRWFGDAGALAAAALAALAELQAAGASVARLAGTGGLDITHARWGLVALLAASALSKSVLAFASGGVRYGRIVCTGLVAMVAAAALAAWLAPA